MNPGSPASANAQPDKSVSEFELPDRTRELATRIIAELINPCRQRLANAERKREEAIEQAKQSCCGTIDSARQALAKADAEFVSLTEKLIVEFNQEVVTI